MMDLAALRIRDTLKNLGDLAELADRYEAVTGVTIDHDVVEYQTVLYNALSVVSVGPPLADPVPGTDWISYLAWYVNGARWAFESIAEIRGYTLDPVEIPDARPTRHAPALRYLVDGMRAAAGRHRDDYELAGLGRIASHLKRVDEIGAQFDADDLDDAGRPARPPARSCRGRRRAGRLHRHAPARSTRRRSSVSSTPACSACTSPWRRPRR